MSKLVSRWADDDSLVQEAIKQDAKVTKHTSDWDKPITVKPNEALPSRWANVEPEPEPEPELEHKPIPKSPKKYNRNKRDKKDVRRYHEYPTPPQSKHDDINSRHGESEQEHHVAATKKDDEEAEKGPMTDAAKAFASRLGIPVGGFNKPQTEESGEWEDEEEEVIKRRSEKPLTSRLSKLSINETKKSKRTESKYKPPKLKQPEGNKKKNKEDQKMTEEEKIDLQKLIEEIKSAGTSSWADEE